MGNRLSGRSHRKGASSLATAADSSSNKGSRHHHASSSSSSAAAAATSSGSIRFRSGKRSHRSPRHQMLSCPDLGSGGGGAVPYDPPDPRASTCVQVSAATSSAAVDDQTDSSRLDVKVYRSYAGDVGCDDDDMTSSRSRDVANGGLRVPGGGRGFQSDSTVPDIKFYRRSAALYNDEDDDDDVDDGADSTGRVPIRSHSATDGMTTNIRSKYSAKQRNLEENGHVTMNKFQDKTSPPVIRITATDFPDTETVRSRLRQFETFYVDALVRRYSSLPTTVDRLSVVSVAIHLQSRPRRTVSLHQYLSGRSGPNGQDPVPVELLDPRGDNTGEYIITVPDSLFRLAMYIRLSRSDATTGSSPSKILSNETEAAVCCRLGEEMVRCAGTEAAAELSRMYEYQIALLGETASIRLLAEHAVQCAGAYISRSRGVWERNSIVRGTVFGAVFGHTELTTTGGGPVESAELERRRQHRVSVVVGQRELKWDVGDILKRPGLRRDRLLQAADLDAARTAAVPPDVPPGVPPGNSATTTTPSVGEASRRQQQQRRRRRGRGDSGELPGIVESPASGKFGSGGGGEDAEDGRCPWTFHVSAACDVLRYGYRGTLLDWDYFANAYSTVADDEGWFDETAARHRDDFHRLYRPYRCLVGTELMQAYCTSDAVVGSSHRMHGQSIVEFVRTRLGVDRHARDVVAPVYRPLKALSLGRLRRADFAGVDLTRISLSGADLRRTGLRGCTLAFGRLSGANFGRPVESVAEADLSYSILTDAEMSADFVTSLLSTGGRATFAVIGSGRGTTQTGEAGFDAGEMTGEEKEELEECRQCLIVYCRSDDGADAGEVSTVGDVVADFRRKVEEAKNQQRGQTTVGPPNETQPSTVGQPVTMTTPAVDGLKAHNKTTESNSDKRRTKKRRNFSRRRNDDDKPTANSNDSTGSETNNAPTSQKKTKKKKNKKPREAGEERKRKKKSFFRFRSEDGNDSAESEKDVPSKPGCGSGSGAEARQPLVEEPAAEIVVEKPSPATAKDAEAERSPVSATVDFVDRSLGASFPVSDGYVDDESSSNIHLAADLTSQSPPETDMRRETFDGIEAQLLPTTPDIGDSVRSSMASMNSAVDTPPPSAGKIYGKTPDAGYLSEVHSSLPVLVQSSFGSDERSANGGGGKLATTAASSGGSDAGQGRMTKAVSLQGHQLLSVNSATYPSRRGPGNTTYRPLRKKGRERVLSRLEIEYINKSQIFQMITELSIKPLECILPEVESLAIGRRLQQTDEVVELVATSGHWLTIIGGYGVGKSTLAVAAAHALKRKSIVSVRVDALGCTTADGIIRRTMRTFGLHFRSADERKYFYNWLNAHDQRLLMLFDDVDDMMPEPEIVALSAFVDELAAGVKNLRLLFTACRPFYRPVDGGSAQRTIYRLDDIRFDSERLVGRLLPDLHDEGVRSLAAACGHVPFALRLVTSAMSSTVSPGIDIGRLFEALTVGYEHKAMSDTGSGVGRCLELLKAAANDDAVETENQLRRMADCVLKTLDAVGENCRRTLVRTACFASGFDVDAAAVVAPSVDVSSVQKSVDRLVDLGLLLIDDADSRQQRRPKPRYRHPRFVRLIAGAMATGSDDDAHALYRTEMLRRLSDAARHYHDDGSVACYRSIDAVDADHDNIVDALWRTLEKPDDESAAVLADLTTLEAVAFLADRLPDDICVAVYDTVGRRSDTSGSVDVRCRSLSCLSFCHHVSGRVADATACADRAVELSSASTGVETTLTAEFCLGRALWTADDRRKALTVGRRAFDACKAAVASKSPPNELSSIVAIYVAEWYAWALTQSENIQTARHCYNMTDAAVRGRLAGHPMTIDGLDSRRAIWDGLLLLERAASAARGAADAARRYHGDHPRTAALLARLGDATVRRGCLDESVRAVVDAASMRVRVLGPADGDTAASYKTLAYLMLRAGQYDQAERFGRAALDSCARAAAERDNSSSKEELASTAAEARELIGQAKYRTECRSTVFVQLETRMEAEDKTQQLVARKL